MAAQVKTGEVQFIYHNRWLGNPVSLVASEAAECAADQGYFWAYHGKLMENQSQGFTKDKLKGFAKDLGLETKVFNTCLDSRTHKSTVEQQTAEAQKLGVNATPTFMLNGRFLKLERSFQEVVEAVNEELKKR